MPRQIGISGCGHWQVVCFGLSLLASAAISSNAAAATMTFTPDRDAPILATSTSNLFNNNFGASTQLAVGSVLGGDERTILGFNVAGLGAQPIVVQSVTLRLTAQASPEFPTGVTINPEVHAILPANQGWVEGTGSSSGSVVPGASTWNQMQNGTPGVSWAGSAGLGTAGTDYSSTVLSSLALTSSSYSAGSQIDFNFSGTPSQLTALIQGWLSFNLANSRNPGLLLFDPNGPTNASLDRITFDSREVGGSAVPELIVNFAAVPEPASLCMFIVGIGGLVCLRRRT